MVDVERTGAAKLVAMLEAMAEGDDDSRAGLSVADLSRLLGRDRSIVSRQLQPLVELGLVERSDDARHRLGWRLFTVATRAGDQRLLLLAPPVMRRLTAIVEERVHLSVLRAGQVLTVLSESPRRSVEAVGWVGRTVPPHCTATGRALLLDHTDDEVRAFFDAEAPGGPNAPTDADDLLRRVATARRRGYASVDGELDLDEAAAAAPVRDFSGRIVAALNISAPAYRIRRALTPNGQRVSAAAGHLSALLSDPPDRPGKPESRRPQNPRQP